MTDDWAILRIPPHLLAALRSLAREAGVTPGQYLRDFVSRQADLHRPDAVPRPKGPGVAMLRELVEDILFRAASWQELQSALVAEGFALKIEGYGLVLHAWPSDEPICKSGDLGYPFAELLRRLGPGEPPVPAAPDALKEAS